MANMALLKLLAAALSTIISLSPPLLHALLAIIVTVASFVADSAPPVHRDGDMDALHVSTRRQLEDIFQQFVPLFEGNESEQNWILRENAVKKLRKLTWGDAPHRFPKVYVAGIKLLLDGILKTVNSLRTTLSANGCKLVQDIAASAGSGWTGGLDPSMIDILLQNLIKLCCNTKNLAAENGNATVTAILANVPYSARLLQHIWHACEHKNEKPRTYASGWLETIFTKHGHHKNTLEHAGGIELIEKCIKKGLADANPGVREGMRGTFWAFAQLWPERSQVIMTALDAKQQGFLTKHPANPNPTNNNPTTDTKPARSALKDTIAAHKREKATGKDLPLRPRSAQPTEILSTDTKPVHSPNKDIIGTKATGKDLPLRLRSAQPTDNLSTDTKPVHSPNKDTIGTKATGKDLPLRPRSAQPTEILSTDTKPVHSPNKDTIGTKATGKDLPPRPWSTQPINKPIENIRPVHSHPEDLITTKATGEELPRVPRSTQHAYVEEDASLDDLFIEKPEPEQPSLENAKPDSKPMPQQDSIFGAKRAREAGKTPQEEQLPKDVKRLLVGPRRRPRKPVVKSAEDVCFIKPKKNRAKVETEQADVRVRQRPALESPKPVRVDSSHWGWRKCLFKGQTQRALTGLLSQRLELDDNSLATIKLEDDLEVATDMCKTHEAICALLEFLEAEHWKASPPEMKINVPGLTSTTLYMLSYLLRRQMREIKDGKQAFTDKQALPLADLAQKCMHDNDVQVRAATIDYCRHLYAATTTSQFWKISEGDESLEALIWYHLMKDNVKAT